MKIIIQGQDYTSAIDAVRPLTIERKLNEPSICQLWLSLPANGSLVSPSRYQSLAVTGDDGTPYFTGYIAVSPLPEYAGLGLEGPRYRTAIQAISDELLLDLLLMPPSAGQRAKLQARCSHRSWLIRVLQRCRAKGSRWQQQSIISLRLQALVGASAPARLPIWRGLRIER